MVPHSPAWWLRLYQSSTEMPHKAWKTTAYWTGRLKLEACPNRVENNKTYNYSEEREAGKEAEDSKEADRREPRITG